MITRTAASIAIAVVIAAVVVGGAAAGVAFLSRDRPDRSVEQRASWAAIVDAMTTSFTISGTQTVHCLSYCSGYGDFHEGTQATLVDETGRTIAVTTLRRNSSASAGSAEYTFTFTGVPRTQRYGFHAGNANRGVIWMDRQDAVREGFHLVIGS
ncbi:hypothetical protein [Amycolatopsis jejuensis]|uniref:hypothetical protein n=1 Tax=Amycolatopsis jejuensis TaxID=330084 RepID=UPI0005274659|nr:hypothetical protein [Amycolatopsis jejuensis]